MSLTRRHVPSGAEGKEVEPRGLSCHRPSFPLEGGALGSGDPTSPQRARQCPGGLLAGPGTSVQGWCCFLPVRLGAHSGDMSRCLADVQPCSRQPTITQHRDIAGRAEGRRLLASSWGQPEETPCPLALGGRWRSSMTGQVRAQSTRCRCLGWTLGGSACGSPLPGRGQDPNAGTEPAEAARTGVLQKG